MGIDNTKILNTTKAILYSNKIWQKHHLTYNFSCNCQLIRIQHLINLTLEIPEIYTNRFSLLFLVANHVQLFYNPMDYSLPDSSIHGISQARILEWAAISFSREFS